MDPRRQLSPTGSSLTVLEKRIYMSLRPLRPQLENKKILVAVSGGADSVFLLRTLVALRGRFNWNLVVAHVDHGVRGARSNKDARFTEKLAKELHVPFLMTRFQETVNSSEDRLRQLRYGFLREVLNKLSLDLIATAHHEDDLLETRLMRLLQGTGPLGLQGMVSFDEKNKLFRPLLSLTKAEILEALKHGGVRFCTDVTNQDVSKFRNWVRLRFLKVLRRDHPEMIPSIKRSLERLSRPLMTKDDILGESAEVFSREKKKDDNAVYKFLKKNSTRRVTEEHVFEFQKRLDSPRRSFEFSLAGRRWKVEKQKVIPIP